MISQERAAIRARIRDALLDMSTAEKDGDDREMLALAESIKNDAKQLLRHAEEHGL